MTLVKTTTTSLTDRLRNNLRTKYGMGGSVLPDTSCLLLDISGSMRGWKITELRKLADEFRQARRFEFSSACDEIPASAQVSEPNGGTALDVGFLYVKKRGITHVVLITDGEPDSRRKAIDAAIGLKVDCFYVGPDDNDSSLKFLEELAVGTGGQYGKVSLERLAELKAAVKERLMLDAPKGAIEL